MASHGPRKLDMIMMKSQVNEKKIIKIQKFQNSEVSNATLILSKYMLW